MFFSSVLPSEASPSPRPPPRGCDRLPYTCLAGGRARGSGRGGEAAGAARAAWLPALVHIRMSDDSCHGCSWHGSSCQGQGAWPHAWMHSALPRGTRLSSTGLQLREASLAGRVEGLQWEAGVLEPSPHRGASCEFRVESDACMCLGRADPPELPRPE